METQPISILISPLDTMAVAAREMYGDRGAVLVTPDENGQLWPEVAEIERDQHKSGSGSVSR